MAICWPEPVQRVQLLAESGLVYVPAQYVRPQAERPHLAGASMPASPLPHRHHRFDEHVNTDAGSGGDKSSRGAAEEESLVSIPVLDLADLEKKEKRAAFLKELRRACEEWGFFHLKNHGVAEEVVEGVRKAALAFFKLPIVEKQVYANDPVTYQGYGSRLGVTKGALLDWSDYFFLALLPASSVDFSKWPTNPPFWREMVEAYSKQVMELFKKLMAALSISLGLEGSGCEGNNKGRRKGILEEAFGEVDMGLRVNYYPPCPQPELTFGLSPHSDPGGLTILLQDHQVPGLQVKAPPSLFSSPSSPSWVTVPPVPGSLVVNLGDQLQILTNGKYKSAEHRVVVNNSFERLSLACFVNPGSDTLVSPLKELVPKDKPPVYNAMTFKQYRAFVRNEGLQGKAHLNYITSPA